MKKFFLEIQERWKSELSVFWKKIRKISVILGSIAVTLVTANATFGLVSVGVPEIIFTVSGYVITFCVATGLSAQITKQ